MKQILDAIKNELDQAGQVSPVSPLLLKLDGCRITSETEVPKEEFLFRMFGKPCFPRRELSAVTGLEKCGKTFFTTMVLASCVQQNVLELERVNERPLKAMWFDTEQSKSSTKGILTERVFRLCGQPKDGDSHFFVFNVRSCSHEERMDYLVEAIRAYQPDIVIIDNVSDLLSSVNDAEQSNRVIEQLMHVASEYNCNITVVIHLNRSGEKGGLRGWLGTEIKHKAYEVYYCEYMKENNMFAVDQTMSRKFRIMHIFYYCVTDEGLPEETEGPRRQSRDSGGHPGSNKPDAYQINTKKADSFNQKYIVRHDDDSSQPWEWNLRQLFDDALGSAAEMSVGMLKSKVMGLSGIKFPNYYDKVFNLAVDQRIVQTTMDRNGRIVVVTIPS